MRAAPARAASRGLLSIALLSLATTVQAAITVGIDTATLNVLLAAATEQQVEVPISETRSVAVVLDDLHVVGLDAAASDGKRGVIETSLRLRVPEIGLNLDVAPRISLNVIDMDGISGVELRFERVDLKLPLAGAIDIAPLLRPMRYPADAFWTLAGATGDVEVRSRLQGIRVGADVVRFEFDLAVVGD